MLGEHPGKAGGIGSDAHLQEEEDGPPQEEENGAVGADSCLTLGLVFQPCWHISVVWLNCLL